MQNYPACKVLTLIQLVSSADNINFASSLEPDQAQQIVRPGLTLAWYSWKNFSKKVILKNRQRTKKACSITQHAKRLWSFQASRSDCTLENYFTYFSTKTYVVGAQKNRLNE